MLEAKLAEATELVNQLGEEYRSGQSNSKAVLKRLKQAITVKLQLQEELRLAG